MAPDGSLGWVKAQGIRYTHSDKNVGVCLAVSHAVAQAQHDGLSERHRGS